MIFLDRQMLLQVLYDTIEHKDRILTGKRVVKLEMSDGELARVHTTEGSVYDGDIVVGADGVHSATRSEMWRLADELVPGTFAGNQEAGKSRLCSMPESIQLILLHTRPQGQLQVHLWDFHKATRICFYQAAICFKQGGELHDFPGT